MQLNEAKFEIINYTLNYSLLLRNLPFTNDMLSYSLTTGQITEPSETLRDLGVILSVGYIKGFWGRAHTFNTITDALGS